MATESNKARVLSLEDAYTRLKFLPDRTPETADTGGAFCRLADCRDGGIFLGHYAGSSEWERHRNGDEIVLVMEGETTLFLLEEGTETAHRLRDGELLVVPQGVWHRFETPRSVKILTVTPQPTDHSIGRPA